MDRDHINAAELSAWPPGIEFLNSLVQTSKSTGWSRSSIYLMLGRGELEAVKDGRRILITGRSIVQRVQDLPRAAIGKKSAA